MTNKKSRTRVSHERMLPLNPQTRLIRNKTSSLIHSKPGLVLYHFANGAVAPFWRYCRLLVKLSLPKGVPLFNTCWGWTPKLRTTKFDKV